ncbi:MAG: SDR family oxidoreductase [Pseudomonadota bacterium]
MTAPEKRALITGGAHRVGRAIATDLAAHGYDVAIHANTSATAAQALADELAANYSVRTAVVTGDLADPDAVVTLVPAAVAALGPLSLLINNASLFEEDALSDMTPERWRRQMAVNAEAPTFLAQAFAAGTDSGLIVNMIDQRVWKPTPRHFSYSASKATLWWLTRTMAQALAPKIRVMAIGPGPVIKSASQTEVDFAQAVAAVPLQRAPALVEFGAAIRFMAETPSMTGQMFALDGGQHMAWQTPDALINE